MHAPLNAEVARLIDARIARDLERRRVASLVVSPGESRTPLAWLVARFTGRPPELPSPARRV
jgi:hypothetical protein